MAIVLKEITTGTRKAKFAGASSFILRVFRAMKVSVLQPEEGQPKVVKPLELTKLVALVMYKFKDITWTDKEKKTHVGMNETQSKAKIYAIQQKPWFQAAMKVLENTTTGERYFFKMEDIAALTVAVLPTLDVEMIEELGLVNEFIGQIGTSLEEDQRAAVLACVQDYQTGKIDKDTYETNVMELIEDLPVSDAELSMLMAVQTEADQKADIDGERQELSTAANETGTEAENVQ